MARRHVTVSTLTRNNVMTVTRRVTVSRLSTGEGSMAIGRADGGELLGELLGVWLFHRGLAERNRTMP